MKRIVMLAMVIIFVLGIGTATAYAQGNTYRLDELDMEITLSDEWTVITRDTPANDPAFDRIGIDGSQWLAYMKQSNRYLDAICLDTGADFSVIMTMDTEDVYDFNLLSDAQLNTFIEDYLFYAQAQYEDITYTDNAIYAHAQARFIVLDAIYEQDTTVYGRQYLTCINGQIIIVGMNAYGRALTTSQKNELKAIVDGIVFFQAAPSATASPNPTAIATAKNMDGVTATTGSTAWEGGFDWGLFLPGAVVIGVVSYWTYRRKKAKEQAAGRSNASSPGGSASMPPSDDAGGRKTPADSAQAEHLPRDGTGAQQTPADDEDTQDG